MHEFIVGNDKKKHDFVCARELANPRDCIICDKMMVKKYGTNDEVPAKPSDKTLGLAILRKELDDGSVVDVLHEKAVEIEVDGEKVSVENVPVVGVIKQGQRNFWDNFNGYYTRYKTTIDRDYVVTRQGKDKNTKYAVIPLDFEADSGVLKDGKKSKALLEETYAVALASHPSLIEYIEKLGSVERYDFFLGERKPQAELDDETEVEATDETEEGPVAEKPAAKTAASSLQAKLLKHKKAAA